MISVEIYIKVGEEYKRIDLHDDEKISLTSSIQNVNDLSKVFTDYTQSFTIPASKANNQIFNYWNENAVNDGFDQRIRYDAIIELNTIPFKKGQIQIEKANEKDNRVESFSVTFYGKVKQIKDLFKDDKLSILDYSSLNHPYNFTEVSGRVNGDIDDGVYYPLIGNQHKYEYLTGTGNDITVGGSPNNSIVYTDLLPAIPISKVFDFMQTQYGITFTSTLFATSYWSELYLYCKNAERANIYTAPVVIDFDSVSPALSEINLTSNTYTPSLYWTDGIHFVLNTNLTIHIEPTDLTIPYRLKIRKIDGTLHQVFDNIIGVFNSVSQIQGGEYNQTFYYEIESLIPITFDTIIYIDKSYWNFGSGWAHQLYTVTCNTQSTVADINIADYVPDMKIVDFFNGIIKIFNLTITATSETEFNLEPLEFFYNYGNYIDINNYVINDSVDIERTKLYKRLSFKHETSNNILNNYFRNTFNRGWEYGDLIWEDNYSNESATYEIKSPFEDVMWEKATNQYFVTTSLIDKDLKPYKPKPILMYKNGLQTLFTDIQMFDGSGYTGIETYQRFSNELFINQSVASLNFGDEQSSWIMDGSTADSLFGLWYKNYISGLYNIRCRIVKLKAIIPITKLADIKLNDKLIYKDKKYIINQYTTDLTTGEVDLELVTDFREISSSTTGSGRFALKQTFNIDNTAQNLEITIQKLNSEYYDVQYDDTSFDSSGNYADGTFIVPIDDNTTGDTVFKQIEITYHNPDVKQYINIIQNA